MMAQIQREHRTKDRLAWGFTDLKRGLCLLFCPLCVFALAVTST